MDKNRYGTHQTHCCILHGCKYGDEDCPVENGEIEQEYICEDCGNKGIKSIEELKNRLTIENREEFSSEEIDRITISKDNKRVKIVLKNGERMLVDFDKITYIH